MGVTNDEGVLMADQNDQNDQNEATIGVGRVAAIYARAPEPSDLDRTTVAEQLDAGRALAAELGYTVAPAATLSDSGPGTTMARPGLTTLLGLIAKGEAGAVIVYTLDRLARLEGEALRALLKELRRRETPLYVAKRAKGYRYDPKTGALLHDPEAVAAANREDARPPQYIVIPREDDRD